MSNGNMYILKKGAVGSEQYIIGQLEGSMTVGGTPVEITDKGNGGAIKYLDGFIAGKQVVFTATFTLVNDTLLNEIKAAAESGAQEHYTIETGVGGEAWSGKFMVTRSDTAAMNGSSTMSGTFSSSDGYTYTPAVVAA